MIAFKQMTGTGTGPTPVLGAVLTTKAEMSVSPWRMLPASEPTLAASATTLLAAIQSLGLVAFGKTVLYAETVENFAIESETRYQWLLPTWLTILIVIGIAAICFWTYAKQRLPSISSDRLSASTWTSGWKVWPLAICRFSALCLILWMLAGWIEQPYRTDVPELMILIDRSESMNTLEAKPIGAWDGLENASGATRLSLTRDWFERSRIQPLAKLSQRFRLRWFSIGDALQALTRDEHDRSEDSNRAWPKDLRADEQHSRLGECIRQAIALSRGRTVSGLVVFSDGITTDGLTLLQAASQARQQLTPVHFVGVGREQRQPDVRVRDLVMDPTVFLGDLVTVQATLSRQDVDETRFRVVLTDAESGELLDEQDVLFGPKESDNSIRMLFTAKTPGTRTVQLALKTPTDDLHPENNVAQRSIEIRDAAIPVLFAQQYPSYEFRFLKHLLERTRQPASPDKSAFRLTTVLEEADPKYADQDVSAQRLLPAGQDAFNAFEVIILGDVSPNMLSRSVQQSLKQFVSFQGGGLLVIAGPKHMPHEFRESLLASLLPIEVEATSQVSPIDPFRWRLTTLGEHSLPLQLESDVNSNKRLWSQLPWQRWRAGQIRPRPIAQVLAVSRDPQGIEDPLLVTQFVGAGRVAFQATDETFQWQNYRGDDLYYQRYWIQMIRWLSRNKSLESQAASELIVDGRQFRFGETVPVKLRLAGPLIALASESSVQLLLTRDSGFEQHVELAPSPLAAGIYEGSLADLKPGPYRLELSEPNVSRTGTSPSTVEFSVTAPPGELAELRPAMGVMQEAAEIARGRFFTLADADQLIQELPESKSIRLQPLPPMPIWNHPWVIVALITLLTAEWLGRRKLGLP